MSFLSSQDFTRGVVSGLVHGFTRKLDNFGYNGKIWDEGKGFQIIGARRLQDQDQDRAGASNVEQPTSGFDADKWRKMGTSAAREQWKTLPREDAPSR